MIGTIILAAGKGHRFGEMKQFKKYNGVSPLDVVHAKFASVSGIMVLVVPDEMLSMEYYAEEAVAGGEYRLESIKNGLEILKDREEVTHVIIAEAARPFVEEWLISELVDVGSYHDLAIVFSPCPHVMMQNVSEYGGYKHDEGIWIHKPRGDVRLIEPPSMWNKRLLDDVLNNIKPRTATSQVPAAYAPMFTSNIQWVNAHCRNPKITFKHEFGMFEKYVETEECQKLLKPASQEEVESAP